MASYHSNTIEGATLNLNETRVLINELQSVSHKPYGDQMVITHHAALSKDILCGYYKESFSEELIKSWHKRLFDGVRGDAGGYSQMHRMIHGSDLALTHPEDIPEEMGSIVIQLNKRVVNESKILGHLAACHAAFELIHPFDDGNGRIGRLLLMKQCMKYKLPPVIIRSEKKLEYLDCLAQAQRHDESHLAVFFYQEMKVTHELIARLKG